MFLGGKEALGRPMSTAASKVEAKEKKKEKENVRKGVLKLWKLLRKIPQAGRRKLRKL